MDSSDNSYELIESFFKFQISFRIFVNIQDLKIFKRGVNIDQIARCYTSMDSSQETLQTNGKLFSNFGIIFCNNYTF